MYLGLDLGTSGVKAMLIELPQWKRRLLHFACNLSSNFNHERNHHVHQSSNRRRWWRTETTSTTS